jgi:hypothetical protein
MGLLTARTMSINIDALMRAADRTDMLLAIMPGASLRKAIG